jgi:hypothetical protein
MEEFYDDGGSERGCNHPKDLNDDTTKQIMYQAVLACL